MSRSQPQVSFAQVAQLCLVPQDEVESTTKWYSQEQQSSFRQQMLNDIRRMRNVAADNAVPDYEYVGIETLLSRELVRLVNAKRRHHIATVLAEQRSHQGQIDEERLCQVSRKSSWWSCEYAHILAKNASEIAD